MTPVETLMLQNFLIAYVLVGAGVGFSMHRCASIFSAVKKLAHPLGFWAVLAILVVLPFFFELSLFLYGIVLFLVMMPTLLVWVVGAPRLDIH